MLCEKNLVILRLQLCTFRKYTCNHMLVTCLIAVTYCFILGASFVVHYGIYPTSLLLRSLDSENASAQGRFCREMLQSSPTYRTAHACKQLTIVIHGLIKAMT